VTQLAQQEGFVPSYVMRLVRVAFLAPEIVEAALTGRQHRSLDATIVRSESPFRPIGGSRCKRSVRLTDFGFRSLGQVRSTLQFAVASDRVARADLAT
jgi:hypothetical protein